MDTITVWICGPLGKMGTVLRTALEAADDISVTGFVSPEHVGQTCDALQVYKSLEELSQATELPHIIVDFTVADACYENAMFAAQNNVDFVTGTTGMNVQQIDDIKTGFASSTAHAIIAPNFSVGVVLMMHYAAQAAKHFERAEIVESHHISKKDAPSGTAIATQRMMIENSSLQESDIPIHSLRLPGAVPHQQVSLSSSGEILRIEHDANDRSCFMPGIILSIRSVRNISGVLFSIESLLFPDDTQ